MEKKVHRILKEARPGDLEQRLSQLGLTESQTNQVVALLEQYLSTALPPVVKHVVIDMLDGSALMQAVRSM